MGKLKKNLGYQTIYQILNTCIPFITAPYLARALGVTQQGVYSYTASIVAYFVLFAKLGTANYGTRSIAMVNDDKEKRSKVFWEIFLLEFLLSLFALTIYLIYITIICKDNKIIALIQSFEIIACMININWLYFGMEKFEITTTRSILIRIVTVIMLFLLVKSPEDLWIYVLIMTLSNVVNMLVLWTYVPTYISRVSITLSNIWKHFKPNFMLFIPLLAMSVYHIMDKTMLGILSNYTECGYYYNADKIINIPVGVIDGISTVILPRMSYLIGMNKKQEADVLFKESLEATVCAASAIAFGIAAIANEFEPLFFGKGFEACVMLTIILAPVLIIKAFSFTARYQYLIPYHKERDYTTSVILGASANLVANFILIPIYGAMGAVLGTLIAEAVACTMQFIVLRKYISLSKTMKNCFIYIIFGIVMFVMVRFVSVLHVEILVKVVLEIICGASIFCVLCMVYWKITDNKMKDFFVKIKN